MEDVKYSELKHFKNAPIVHEERQTFSLDCNYSTEKCKGNQCDRNTINNFQAIRVFIKKGKFIK